MRQLVLIGIVVGGIGGCASTTPPASENPSGAEPAPARTSASQGNNDIPRSEKQESAITVAEVPRVEAAVAVPKPPQKVCRRVKRTGSHRTQRECTTRSEIEAATTEARQVFDELHRQQQIPPIP